MSDEGLERLRSRVHADPKLARRLSAAAPELFVTELLRVAHDAGAELDEADVAAAAAQGRQAWQLRWIL